MKTFRVGILGGSGTVGQKFIQLLHNHPYFRVKAVTGERTKGKKYGEAVNWLFSHEIPENVRDLVVTSSSPSSLDVDFVFSALPSQVARAIEPLFAENGLPVISNASAFRMEKDVPLIIPEVNPQHLSLIEVQRKLRKWDGYIVTDPNCSTVALAMVLKPILDSFSIRRVIVTTMQAISGAGYPGIPSLSILDNIIPFIPGEEEKIETETLKILGRFEKDHVKEAEIKIFASCNRVPVLDGHLEHVYIEAKEEVDLETVKQVLQDFKGKPQELKLPTAPSQPIILLNSEDRPQPRLDRLAGDVPGMSVVVGKVKQGIDKNSLSLTLLGHNTIRGAAGSAILIAELLASMNML